MASILSILTTILVAAFALQILVAAQDFNEGLEEIGDERDASSLRRFLNVLLYRWQQMNTQTDDYDSETGGFIEDSSEDARRSVGGPEETLCEIVITDKHFKNEESTETETGRKKYIEHRPSSIQVADCMIAHKTHSSHKRPFDRYDKLCYTSDNCRNHTKDVIYFTRDHVRDKCWKPNSMTVNAGCNCKFLPKSQYPREDFEAY